MPNTRSKTSAPKKRGGKTKASKKRGSKKDEDRLWQLSLILSSEPLPVGPENTERNILLRQLVQERNSLLRKLNVKSDW